MNRCITTTSLHIFVSGSLALLASCNLFAAEPLPDETTTLLPDPFVYADVPRDYLAHHFLGLARRLDSFFGDERNYQESNNSLVQLDLLKVAGYGGDPKWRLSGRAKLHLPATEQRLHLLLETNADKNVTGEQAQAQSTPINNVAAPESYAAAVRYEKPEQQRTHFSADAGLKFQGLHSNLFVRGRGSYATTIGDYRFKAAETVFWFNSTGAGSATQLDVERILSEPVLLRATSSATWLHDKQNFDLHQDISLYHTLNARSALLYQASAVGVSHPQAQVNDYVLLVQYRHRLHRQWVFLEVSPQLHFPRTDNYKSNPALLFRLEMLFDKSD